MTESFVEILVHDFPDFHFRAGSRFSFRAPRTIHYNPSDSHLPLLILHELGHALLGHCDSRTDVERLRQECAAWAQAKLLCDKYSVPYDENFAQDQLDSYRNWLHSKSLCRTCGLTRYQTRDGHYHCPHCDL